MAEYHPFVPGFRAEIWRNSYIVHWLLKGIQFGWVLVMARCSYCAQETELYEGGIPVCLACSDTPILQKKTFHARLIEELAEATAEHNAATVAHKRVMWEIPSATPHPDGVQRIHSVSHELSVAKERLARAHSRLSDFLDRGTIPEDMQGS